VTEPRRPLHLGVFLGLSVCGYAASLAGVTAFQAQSETAVIVDRGPTAQSLAEVAARNDALESDAWRAQRVYERATDGYARVGDTLADVETQLAALADIVGAVDGAARSLPDHVALPKVTRVVAAPRSTVHATTGGSGG
jgi:hypothetical protein